MRLAKRAVLMLSIAAVTVPSVTTSAATFNLINIGGAAKGTQAYEGFYIASQYWASVLTDPVTINLDIGFGNLGSNVLAQTSSSTAIAYDSDVYSALAADATSKLDATAVSHLPPLGGPFGNSLTMRVNDFNYPPTPTGSPLDSDAVPNGGYTDMRTRLDNDGSANNYLLNVNTANMKALGLTHDAAGNPVNPAYDASIVFSSGYAFDFNPTNGITAGDTDFVGTAIHEIAHALGFESGVDTYDLFTSPGSPPYLDANGNPIGITYEEALRLGIYKPGAVNLENFAVGTPLDLFRYDKQGEIDWSTSNALKMFSVDGVNPVYGKGAFSLGQYNGDGNQASHWLEPAGAGCSGFLGIMNPYNCAGQMDAVTGLDLAALDAIGWDLAPGVRDDPNYYYTTAQAFAAFAGGVTGTPEPATWMHMILGMGFVGGTMRAARRRRPATA